MILFFAIFVLTFADICLRRKTIKTRFCSLDKTECYMGYVAARLCKWQNAYTQWG